MAAIVLGTLGRFLALSTRRRRSRCPFFDRLANYPDARSHLNRRGLVLPIVHLQSDVVRGEEVSVRVKRPKSVSGLGHRRMSYWHAECVLVTDAVRHHAVSFRKALMSVLGHVNIRQI